MQKQSKTQDHYTTYERHGQVVLALDHEKILPENAPVRLASAQLEELDYSKLYRAYSPKGRKSAAHRLDTFCQHLKTIPKSLGDENRVQTSTLNPLIDEDLFPVLVSSAHDVFLLQRKTNRKIAITHFPFWLGRQVGTDGYSITDNNAVSRRHAYISQSNGRYYLTDNKAPNHTYIDDYRLSGSTRELNPQSIIRLGNEQFVFCVR